MQHIWKVLLTSLLIFALAATACLAEDSEAQYQAYSYTTFSLRRTPSESDRGITVRKKTKILILEWDDAWCKVQVGNKVGYAKPEWLYRVQSLDALHYPLQNLPHRMSGYVEFSQDTLISGGKFKGCTASAGQIACVEAQADGFGYGGGVCQVTTTLYNAALTLPLQIEEWALHSKQGAVYVPQFFDAAVGSYSDFTFVNLLPYGVQIHASAQNGVLTVMFCRAEEDSQ